MKTYSLRSIGERGCDIARMINARKYELYRLYFQNGVHTGNKLHYTKDDIQSNRILKCVSSCIEMSDIMHH